jgi:hypothetical protein
MNDEEFVTEMENYSDLFIDEVVRVGRRSTFPDPDSINIGLSVTVTARFGTTGDDFVTEDVHAVLFKTIDQGKEAIANYLYPPDHLFPFPLRAPPGEIADEKKELVAKYMVEFIDKLKESKIRVTAMTCGRGLPWLVDNKEIKLRGIMCMEG